MIFGDSPPVLGIAQFLAEGCGLDVRHCPKFPEPGTGGDHVPALAGHPVVIHCNTNSRTLDIWSAIDRLRSGSEWMAAYLCIVPDKGWAHRVSKDLEEVGIGTGRADPHRVLWHPIVLVDLLTTLEELRLGGVGVSYWVALRDGMPHLRLLEWCRRWRAGLSTAAGPPLAELLQKANLAFFPHDVARCLAELQQESRRLSPMVPEAEARLARRLCDCLNPILEQAS